MKLQSSKSKSISRNGSSNKRSSTDQYNTNNHDEYYKGGIGIFDKRDSINSQYSGSASKSKQEKPLIQRLYDRVVILQNHIDQISNNTMNNEPIIIDFQQKYQEIMSQTNDKQINEPKETPIPLTNEDFQQLESIYGELQRDMKVRMNNLNSQFNDVHKVIESINEQINFSREQNNIMIQESELQMREVFLQEIAQFDNQLDQEQEQFNKVYLDEIEKAIENNLTENLSQMEIIGNFLSQIEEEWDGRIEQLQSKIEFVNQLQKRNNEGMLTKEKAKEWMVAKTFEIQKTVEKNIETYIEEQLKLIDTKQHDNFKKDISKIQSYIQPVKQLSSSTKENLPDNMQRSSTHSIVSTKTSMSTQSQSNNKRKLKQLIVQGLTDLETFEAFVIESSEVISTQQEQILQASKKGVFEMTQKKIQDIKSEIEVRHQKCQQQISNLESLQTQVVQIKKQILDNDKNMSRVLQSHKDEFQNIDVFIDHFDALKSHIANTHQFLLKQFSQIKQIGERQ